MSRTVDEKVVSMQFDNAQFERNVHTSMNTLEQLKRSLNMEGASKSLNEVNEAARRFDMSSMSNSIDTVQAKFSALQVIGVTALANITNSAVNAGKRIMSSITDSLVGGGIRRAENIEQAKFQLEGLSVSWKTVSDDIDYAVKGTAYGMDAAAKACSQLVASNVEAGDSMKTALRGISGVAAMTNSSYEDISRIFTTVAGNGRLMGEQLLQISSRGINAAAALAKYLNVSEAEVRDMTSKGKIDFATFAAAMDSAFGEHAKDANKTFSGALANMKAALARIGADVATSGLDNLRDIFNELRVVIDDAHKSLGPFIDALNKTQNKVSKFTVNFIKLGGLHNILSGIGNIFEGIWSVIKPIKEAFRDIFPPKTAQQIADVTKRFSEFTEKLKLSDSQSEKLRSTFKGLFAVADILVTVLKGIAGVALTLIGHFTGLGDSVLTLSSSFGDWLTNLRNSIKEVNVFGKAFEVIGNVLEDVWGLVKKVGSGIGEFLGNLFNNGSFSAGVGFAAVILLVRDTFIKLEGVRAKVGRFFKFLQNGYKIADQIQSIFSALSSSLWNLSRNLQYDAILKIAYGVGILAASLFVISSIDKDKLMGGIAGIGALTEILVIAMKQLSSSMGFFNKKNPAKGIKGLLESFADASRLNELGNIMIKISVSLLILAIALKQIGEMNWDGIAKGLVGIGASLAILMIALKKLSKINSMSKKGIKGAGQMIIMAVALLIIAKAMKSMSAMSWEEIAKGLTAMGGALAEFAIVLTIMGRFGGKSISGGAAILIAAQSLDEISACLECIGKLSWKEIGKGLTAMGGALAELAIACGALGKIAGFSGILGGGAILVASQALDEIAECLASISTLSWDDIARGLSGMGGALAELAIVSVFVGKLAGFSGLLGGGAIVLAAKSLDEIANALNDLSLMSWDDIGRGLTAMGGALAELAIVCGLLGKFAGFSGLFGAGTIVLAVQGLNDIADCLQKLGLMSWGKIGKGLSGMGGALAEVAVISGLTGYLTNIAGLFGAGTITLAAQGLGQIADAFQKFGSMSWKEIGHGLAAMGGALTELALGGLLNSLSILGAISIDKIAEPLGVLADSFRKFGEIPMEEAANGLKTMGAALGELALGGFLNTLSLLGSISIAIVAESIGTLADSVKKWIGVEIPDGLGGKLAALAGAIMAFTFDGLGASALATAAPAVGQLADSIKKWAGVVLPEGLESKMKSIANGIKSFSFAFAGGWSIDVVAKPLGTMADSIKKWSGITIPENIGIGLKSIADGVKAFSFAFTGGWSIDIVAKPLGTMADSIKKWSGVTIPEDIGIGLKSIADGIKAFSFAFAGGWSIDTIIEPLNKLASTVKKWAGVVVPENLKDDLKKVADAIKEFSLLDSAKLAVIDGPLNTLSKAFKNFSGISNTGTNLVTFAKNLNSCATELSGIDSVAVSSATSTVNKLIETLTSVNTTDISNVSSFVSAANKLNDIKIGNIDVNTKDLSSAISSVKKTMDAMQNTISNSKSSLNNAMKTAVSGLDTSITSKSTSMISAIKKILGDLVSAIKDYKSNVSSAFESVVSGAAKAIKKSRSDIESAGKYLGAGLVSGIKAKEKAVYNAAYALGQKAVRGEKDGQKSHSPSKLTIQAGHWFGEGLVIGISEMGRKVYKAGSNIGRLATDSLSGALSTAVSLLDSDADFQPTIRPVLDLSDVSSGASSINELLNENANVGVMSNVKAINAMMNRRQNGNSNDDVISAIDKLGKNINDISKPSYTIEGITYDNDSEIAGAIETLISAAIRERRV